VLHVHVDHISEHHQNSADYAQGECEARTSLDPQFAERYFGHQHLLRNRERLDRAFARTMVGVISREIAWASSHHRRDLPWLLNELGSTLPSAAAGVRLPRLLTHLAFTWSERVASLELLPRRRRYAHYLRAQDRMVKLTQLRWIEANPDGDQRGLHSGARGVDGLEEAAVAGVHGLETHDGRWFRWSEPVVSFRLDNPAPAGELRIDTGGLTGSPVACVSGAYLGTQRLPQTHLREEGPALVVELPEHGTGDITLLCRPLTGPGEDRRLGLPLFSVELS
jgi:hypothetical protein